MINRLSNPKDTIVNEDISLASGTAGIIIFLNEIDKVLNIDTKELIHKYIIFSNDYICNYLNDFSLYSGITGFNYAISLINEDTGNYSKLLKTLDDLFIENFTPALNKIIDNKLDDNFEAKFDSEIDLISGLMGITRYILLRKDNNDDMKNLLYKISNYLVKLCEDKNLNGKRVKGWIMKRVDIDENNKIIFTDKYEYNLGIAHGLPAILAILSLLIKNNIEVDGQREVIKNIQDWLLKINTIVKDDIWPCYVTQNNNNYELGEYKRIAWCYGNPGIGIPVLLSSDVSNTNEINKLANNILENIYNIPREKWIISSPMICHGYAGILQVIFRSRNKYLICNHSDELIDKLLYNINLNKKFCFDNNDINRSYDIPGFLTGSTGIALVLLSSISYNSPKWDEVLLLS
nr:lanthionine synthetase C family protein [Clostridium sardiniense]